MRSATADVMVTLQAPKIMGLEDALEYIQDDEFKKNDEQIMPSLDCLASMNGANINFRKYN